MSAPAEPRITSAELVIHLADGTVRRFDFHGGERNTVTLGLASAPVGREDFIELGGEAINARWSSKVEATIKVVGSDRLISIHEPEADSDG